MGLDFNPECFINCHDFDSFDEVVNKVIEVDQSEELYRYMVNQPFFNKKEPEYIQDDFLLNFYIKIFEQPIETAYRRAKYGYNAFYEARSKTLLKEVEGHRNSFKGLKGLLRSFLNKVTS